MNTVGRSTIGEYEAALREVNNPISEDYRPNPDATMNCDDLVEGINYLTSRIQLWTTRLNSLRYRLFSGDRATAENISQILNVLNQKLQLYQQAHQIKCLTVQQPTEAAPTEVLQEATPTEAGSGFLFPLLLIAGGIFIVSRMKKRRNRNRKRKR